MRILAVVLGMVSVSVAAQTLPELKTVTPETVRVSQSVLRGMAEAEPDITAAGATGQGSVLLQVAVSKTGAVQEAVAISGPEDLKKAAADGVMGWSYKPYLLNGQAREIQSTILLDFHDGVGKRAAEIGAMPPGTVRVSSGVAAGMMVQPEPQPVYPPIAKAAHVQGVVLLHALISKTGDIEDLQVISGPPMLTAAAMDAVKKWKYQPYLLNGMLVAVETTINVNFKFEEPVRQPEGAGGTGSGSTQGEAPVRVSSGAMAASQILRPMPACSAPTESNAPGVVMMHAIISKEGWVKEVQVVSGAKSLEECSLAAVRRWRYRPYMVDGEPKEVETTITIDMAFGGRASRVAVK